MVDEPQIGSASVPTVLAVTNPDLSVVRFHGRNAKTWYKKVENTGERFDYLYSDSELEQWTPNVGELAREAGEIHLLFNNNRANYAVRNAHRLTGMLRSPCRTSRWSRLRATPPDHSSKCPCSERLPLFVLPRKTAVPPARTAVERAIPIWYGAYHRARLRPNGA